jgi:hypothetical protein
MCDFSQIIKSIQSYKENNEKLDELIDMLNGIEEEDNNV